MLYSYMENTLNVKISPKSVYISVNKNMKFKKFRFFLSKLYWWIKPKNHRTLLSL